MATAWVLARITFELSGVQKGQGGWLVIVIVNVLLSVLANYSRTSIYEECRHGPFMPFPVILSNRPVRAHMPGGVGAGGAPPRLPDWQLLVCKILLHRKAHFKIDIFVQHNRSTIFERHAAKS